jgi:hypothetical protein
MTSSYCSGECGQDICYWCNLYYYQVFASLKDPFDLKHADIYKKAKLFMVDQITYPVITGKEDA